MTTFDSHANFGYSTVATAPSPATSGTSLVLAAGGGALMPASPFNAVVWPTGVLPLASNAEIVRVTARSTDTLTIVRTQEGSSARAIGVGDQFGANITKKTITDIETAVNAWNVAIPTPSGGDDTSALQALLNAGTDIYLAAGNVFSVTGLAVGTNGQRIFGPGTLKLSASDVGSALLRVNAGTSDCLFEDFTLDGSAAGGRAICTSAITEGQKTIPVTMFGGDATFPVGATLTIDPDGVGGTPEQVVVAAGTTSESLVLVSGTAHAHSFSEGVWIVWSPGAALSLRGYRHELRNLRIINVPSDAIAPFGDAPAYTTLSSSAAVGTDTVAVASATSLVVGSDITIGYALASTTISSNIVVGVCAIPVASASGFKPGQKVIIETPGTTNYEEAFVFSASGGTVTVISPTLHAHNSGVSIKAVAFEEARIRAINGNNVSLDFPIAYAHASGDMIKQPTTSGVRVRDCRILNCAGNAIFCNDASSDGSASVQHCSFEGNLIDGVAASGISMSGAHNLAEGNVIRNIGRGQPSADGITFYGRFCDDCRAVGNEIYASAHNGIHGGGHRVAITGNTVSVVTGVTTGGRGILAASDPNGGQLMAFDASVIGNTVVGVSASEEGIGLYGYLGGVITGNNVRDCGTHGINVTGGYIGTVGSEAGQTLELSDSIVISANSVRSVGADGLRLDSASRVTVVGNTFCDVNTSAGGSSAIFVSDSGSPPQGFDVTIAGNTIDGTNSGSAVATSGNVTRVLVGPSNIISNAGTTPIGSGGAANGLWAPSPLIDNVPQQTITFASGVGTLNVPLGMDVIHVGSGSTVNPLQTIMTGIAPKGRIIRLIFDAPTLINNVNNINLNPAQPTMLAPTNGTLTLVADTNNQWYELARTPASRQLPVSDRVLTSTGVFVEGALPRSLATSTGPTITSGTPVLLLHLVPAGVAITGAAFSWGSSDNGATTRTHLWYALVDANNFYVYAVTSDDTTKGNFLAGSVPRSWGSSGVAASGNQNGIAWLKQGASWVPQQDMWVYAVLLWAGTGTVPTVLGASPSGNAANGHPRNGGLYNVGSLAGPPTLGTVLGSAATTTCSANAINGTGTTVPAPSGGAATSFTLNVASTTSFAASGSIWVSGLGLVEYTGKTSTSFTGCTTVQQMGNAVVTNAPVTGATVGSPPIPHAFLY
jgi:hypothetical protein